MSCRHVRLRLGANDRFDFHVFAHNGVNVSLLVGMIAVTSEDLPDGMEDRRHDCQGVRRCLSEIESSERELSRFVVGTKAWRVI